MPYFHLDNDEHFPCYINKVYKCGKDIIFATNEEEAKFLASSDKVVELTGGEAEIARNEFIIKVLKRHEQAIDELIKTKYYDNFRKDGKTIC